MSASGAREALLAAAERLARRGRSPFSPADLMDEARAGGSRHADSTLRTFIISVMCVNAPSNHAVRYPDLERVGRGQYRLAAQPTGPDSEVERATTPADTGSAEAAVEACRPSAETTDWYSERNVQSLVVNHLAGEGWRIRRVADTQSREHGFDIEADRGDARLLVEVKGYPGQTYSRGEMAGQAKRYPAPSQARAYFSNALLSGLLLRAEHPQAEVVIAFPAMETYRNLSKRCAAPLHQISIAVWLVDSAGEVTLISAAAGLPVPGGAGT